jgi:hypothetical protein
VDALTESVGAIPEKLGRAFLIAGYLPATLFVVVHQLFLFPRWLDRPIAVFQTDPAQTGIPWIYLFDKAVTLLLLPLLLGVLLMALNTVIIRLYEGAYGWQQRFLLWFWQRRNERRAKALYGELVKLKEVYTGTLADLASLPEGEDASQLKQKRVGIALEMQRAHREIEKRSPMQRLPRRVSMIKPTALGNAFAVIEEYPYERYGMDGVLFWPRLRPLLDESYAAALVNTKMILDLMLNLSLLALIFGLETIVFGSARATLDWTLIGVGIGAWILSYVCYRSSVSTAFSLGNTIMLCFDFFRGRVLAQLSLSQPNDIEAEQTVWLQLGQFLRRGEGFYYPKEVEKEKKQGNRATSPLSLILNAVSQLLQKMICPTK